MNDTKHSKETADLSTLRQPWLIASIAGALVVVAIVAVLCIALRPATGTESPSSDDALSSVRDQAQPTASSSTAADTPLSAEELPTYQTQQSPADLQSALEKAQSKPQAPYAQAVEEELQFPLLPGGCEISSLTSVLHTYGYDVPATDLADYYLNIDEEDAAASYFGTPYDMGGGFPPAIAAIAEAYLGQAEATVHALDLTGQDYDTLLQWIDAGYPVLVWTTMYQEYPLFTNTMVGDYEWYDNEHCVVLYGHADDVVQVMDPLEGLVELDAQTFAEIYDQCGKCSLVIA